MRSIELTGTLSKMALAAVFSLLLLATSAPVACASSSEKSVKGLSEILERGTLRVGIYYKDKPPFVMTKEDGSLYGLDIDLANGIARQMGVEVEFDRTSKSYSELIDRVSTGDGFDIVICKMSSTMNRALKARFTFPYLIFHQGLALNKKFITKHKIPNDAPIIALQPMTFKVGARTATSYVEYVRALFPNAEIIEGDWDSLVEALLSGEIDGLMRDEFTLMSLIRSQSDIALHINVYRIKDRKDPIAIAVPKESSMLQYWLNLYLNTNLPGPMSADDLISNYPELWKTK